MPPAIIAAAASAVFAGSWIAGGTLIIGFSLSSFVGSLLLSGISMLISPKPKSPSGAQRQGGDFTQQFRQATPPRRMVFGEVRTSGPIAMIGSSGDNEFLHMLIMLASHEVQSIDEVWLETDSIAPDELDSNGDVTSTACGGKYYKSGVPYVRIKKFIGGSGQSASADMIAAFPTKWTSAHTLSGIAYIYVRLKFSTDVFPSGIPNVSAWVKGYKCYDTRTSLSAWTHNMMLITRAYMADTNLGLGVPSASFNSAQMNSGANTCEEFVTTTSLAHTVSSVDAATDIISLSGDTLLFQTGDRVTSASSGSLPAGLAAATNYYAIVYQRVNTLRIKLASSYANALAGIAIDLTSAGSGTITITKNAEPRYVGGGIVESTQDPQATIESMVAAMAGQALYAGGYWLLSPGVYVAPTISYSESDLIGPYSVATKMSAKDRFNQVQGTYTSPLNNGQGADYPIVKNSTYSTQDGKDILFTLDLPFTQRPHTAMRIAKIALERSRQEIVFTARFKLTAFRSQVGDNISLTITRPGWSAKAFEVVNWAYNEENQNGVIQPFVEMTLKETASTIYDWNNGEETSVDPAPNTTLPSPTTVSAITGLLADSEKVLTQSGDYVYKILAHWNAVTDQFVLQGGWIELQFKMSSDSTWRPTFNLPADFTMAEVTLAAQLNTQYDIRVRAVNYLGGKSAYTSITGYTVGSSGGVGTTADWGNWTDAVGTTIDYGNWTDAVGTTNDWGFYS